MSSFARIILLAGFISTSTLAAVLRPLPPALRPRDMQTCGGIPSLTQCGAAFPPDFCCPSSTTCLQLDTTALAVLCCPAGQDCQFIQPIVCDQSAQNATQQPSNQLHSEPTVELQTCGDACCPMGASCQNGMCLVRTRAPASSTSAPISASSIVASAPTTISEPAATTTASEVSSSVPSSSATTVAAAPLGNETANAIATTPPKSDFSGSAFAAGFVPGIIVGALVVALLLWCLSRRRRQSYASEKYATQSEDQLTDLSTISRASPNTNSTGKPIHQRSISEPIREAQTPHRTDFMRSTPPHLPDPVHPFTEPSCTTSATGPITPARQSPQLKALFTRSPLFPTASSPCTPPTQPLPSHLKRGTLSHSLSTKSTPHDPRNPYPYIISPIRALRTKKSSHSLRRQMTSAAMSHRSRSRGSGRLSRNDSSASTETIKVLMPSREPYTPDQRNLHSYQAPASLPSTRYEPPTPISGLGKPALNSPYTPTRYYGQGGDGSIGRAMGKGLGQELRQSQGLGGGKVTGVAIGDHGLAVEKDGRVIDHRLTTFSGLMERAGCKVEDFVGPVPRR
nr:hypothetical protein B0A51_14868 [Rachicladosporium sp. CCFEE 5018]